MRPLSNRWFWAAAGLLLALFAVRVLVHAASISATFDEPHHLVAGYSYLRWDDYRLNPEHPPLSKKLAALPWLALEPLPSSIDPEGPTVPPGPGRRSWRRFQELWRESIADYRKEWYLGHEVLFGVEDATLERFGAMAAFELDPIERIERSDYLNNPDRLLFWGRVPLLAFGLLTALLVFSWARDLWGPAGGLFALALVAFDPSLIAHSSLVTNDVAATALIVGAVYGLWRYRRDGGWGSAILTIVCFSLALTAKFSTLLLVPMLGLLVAASAARLWREQRRYAAMRLVALLALCAISALLVLWAAYGFRYAAVADPETGSLPVDRVLAQVVEQETRWDPTVAGREHLGLFDRTVSLANRLHLLPESYLQGLAIYRLLDRVRPSFLNGEYSLRGFRTYFLWTFLYKTPLVTLLVVVAALVFVAPRCRREDLLFLLFPATLYFALAAASFVHIGHRHILPVYPFLYILAGGLVGLVASRWPGRETALLGTGIALVALSSVLVFLPPWRPVWIADRPLEFFNELAGGPQNGYRHLVDSNLDWGQGLGDLQLWLERNQVDEPINLCYFGTADPRWYQIRHVRVPCEYLFAPPLGPDDAYRPTIVPGYLAISATHLQGERDTAAMREMRWRALERAELVDRVGHSIFIYRLPESK